MNFRTFESKTKNAELDAFDVLMHCASMYDLLFKEAVQAGDYRKASKMADRMLEVNDRYLAVILGLDEEQKQYEQPEPKQGFGFNQSESKMDSLGTPNGEPGEL